MGIKVFLCPSVINVDSKKKEEKNEMETFLNYYKNLSEIVQS